MTPFQAFGNIIDQQRLAIGNDAIDDSATDANGKSGSGVFVPGEGGLKGGEVVAEKDRDAIGGNDFE